VQESVQYRREFGGKFSLTGSQQLVKVYRYSREDGVDRISGNALQPVTFHPVFVLQMSDARFDGRSVFHPLPERLWCSASLSFVHMDRGMVPHSRGRDSPGPHALL
jgi:hypothetical protein